MLSVVAERGVDEGGHVVVALLGRGGWLPGGLDVGGDDEGLLDGALGDRKLKNGSMDGWVGGW